MAGGGFGGKDRSKAKGQQAAPVRDPAKELARALGRILATPGAPDTQGQIVNAIRGMTPGQVRRASRAAELPPQYQRRLVDTARGMRADRNGGDLAIVPSAFNWTLQQASRPVQGVTSAVAEWSRQGEANPVDLGPLSLRYTVTDPGAILKAATEGFELKRHDTPTSIATEAGKIREKQGVGTESFGVVPGTDLAKGEALPGGTPGKVVYDVGGMMGLDPLTYLTFGMGAAAKQGVAATARTLGVERATEVASMGPKILTAEEKARLGRDVVSRLKGVKGGMGVRVPQPIRAVREGKNLLAPPRTIIPQTAVSDTARKISTALQDTAAGSAAVKPFDGLQRAFVPRAGVTQAERSGRLRPGTADELDRMRVAYKSGSDASEDIHRITAIKKAHKLNDAETEQLLVALETSPDGLTPKVRGAYDELHDYRVKLAEEKRAAGLISTPEEVRTKRMQGLRGKYEPKFNRAAKQIQRIQERVAIQQQRVAEAQAAVDAAKAEAEFVGVPAVAGRRAVEGEHGAQVPHFTGQDIAQTKAVGKAEAQLAREKAMLRVVNNLEKSAQKRINTLGTRAQRDIANLPGDLPDEQYVPHIPGQQVRDVKAEKRAAIMGSSGPNVSAPEPGFARRRTIRETIGDANAAGQEFETDPFLAFAKHAPEARKAIATRQFVDDALKLTDSDGIPLLKPIESVGDMTDEALADAGLERVTIPRVGEFVVDEALKPEITKVARLASGDKTVYAFYRGLDRWMTLWKGYATVPLPFGIGFHMRNGTSNVMLNWLADINPIDPAYAQAFRLQRGISKGMKEGDALKYLRGTKYEDVARAALDRDVIGGAFFIEDLPPELMRGFKTKGQKVREGVNPIDPNNVLIRGGRRVGLEIEENARLAHFIVKYREFGNFDDAAASVRKYLFDYGDLTPFEQDVMKRIMPFYTFTRKNTPLWIAAAAKQPGKYSRIAEWRTAIIDAAGGQPDGPIPKYLEAQAAVPVPGMQMGGGDVMAAPDMPPVAAMEVLDPALQLAALVPGADKLGLKKNEEGPLAALRPWFSQTGGGALGLTKAIYDLVEGRDSFTGRPFYSGEQVNAPIYTNPLGWAGLDNPLIPKRKVDGEMVPAIDRRLQYLLEAAFPLSTKLRSLVPTAAQDQDKQSRRAISMFTGLQLYPLGEATQRGELFRRVEILRQRLADMASRGIEVPDLPPSGGSKKRGGF